MANSTSSKHMVWVEKPAGNRIGIAYSTLKEAQLQTVALERDGYTIIEIVETSLPKPNVG
jgi:hypothetical protein